MNWPQSQVWAFLGGVGGIGALGGALAGLIQRPGGTRAVIAFLARHWAIVALGGQLGAAAGAVLGALIFAPSARVPAAIYAAAYCGLAVADYRRGRHVALLRDVIDLKDQTIGFQNTQLRMYRRLFPGPFDIPPTGGEVVTIYIPPGGAAPPAPPGTAPSPN